MADRNFVGSGPKMVDSSRAAGVPLTPGQVVEISTANNNTRNEYILNNDGDVSPLCVVLPDLELGRGDSDAYAVNDKCHVAWVLPGQTAKCFVNNGNSLIRSGTVLTHGGSGALKPAAARTGSAVDDQPVAVLDQASMAASNSASIVRVRGV